MKGFIGPDGDLKIVRNGLLRTQHCPYSSSRTSSRCCGIWCPLFDDSDADFGEVQLCNGKRVFIMRQKKGE